MTGLRIRMVNHLVVKEAMGESVKIMRNCPISSAVVLNNKVSYYGRES